MQISGGKGLKMVLCFRIYIQSSLVDLYGCTISNQNLKIGVMYPFSLIPALKIFDKEDKFQESCFLNTLKPLQEK